MPVPMPTGLVVKKGSKMRPCASSGMPHPVSETLSTDSLPSVPVNTRISFSRGSLSPRACIALTRRFITTWCSFPRGAKVLQHSGPTQELALGEQQGGGGDVREVHRLEDLILVRAAEGLQLLDD